MQRTVILVYGLIAYLAFFVTILYAIGFVSAAVVPKHIDSPELAPLFQSILANLGLLVIFGVTHSAMARPAFKERITKLIPQAAERSTFVLVASLQLMLAFWLWHPITSTVWHVDIPALVIFLRALSLIGWVLVFWSSFLINHFDLFGVRQVWLYYNNLPYTHLSFTAKGLYKHVRHPLMLGFLIAFWSTPHMTLGHLLFAAGMTLYILIGVTLEEKDLADHLGDDYKRYQESTSMIFPWSKKS